MMFWSIKAIKVNGVIILNSVTEDEAEHSHMPIKAILRRMRQEDGKTENNLG